MLIQRRPSRLDDLDARRRQARRARRRRGRGREPTRPKRWLGQARHRDSAARRSSGITMSGILPAPRRLISLLSAHSWTHPEGWRDWPDETPATSSQARTVAIPQAANWPGRCGRGVSRDLRHSNHGGGFFDHAGRCPEVQGVLRRPTRSRRATSASAASARSRSRYDGSPTATPPRCAGASRRARRTSGATRTSCPLEGPRRARAGLPTGCTPLVRADRLAERLGLREVWVKNDAANPTHSFKDRVVSVASARARELGFETLACASTGNLANAVAAHAAAAGLESYVFIPADLEEQKILATGVYGTNLVAVRGNYDDVNRLCTELSARARRGRSSTSTCARTTPRAPRRSPTRSPSSSAGRCPTASSRRSPRARCSRRSPRASRSGSSSGCVDGELPTIQRRAGRSAARRSPPAFADGTDVCRPVKPDTIAKSLAIGNPADGPYALELARDTGGAIDSRHRRRDPRRHPPAGRDDRHLHRDGRRRDHRDAGQARRARRHRP